MPLWHIDYFELKAIEKKQIQEKLFALFPLPQSGTLIYKGVFPILCPRKDNGQSPDNFRAYQPGESIRRMYKTNYWLDFISTIGSLKLLPSFLPFLYEFTVHCWRCYINWKSKLPQGATHFPLGSSHVYMYHC